MQDNLKRLEEEVTWFTDKYDYRNKEKDWGNSRESIERCMQKAAGRDSAEPSYQADRWQSILQVKKKQEVTYESRNGI